MFLLHSNQNKTKHKNRDTSVNTLNYFTGRMEDLCQAPLTLHHPPSISEHKCRGLCFLL